MNRLRTLGIFVAALALLGCQQLYPGVTIDTTREAILVANAEVRGQNLLLQDLLRAGTISAADAQQAKDHLQTALDGLEDALTAVDVHGDPATGADRLERAVRVLDLAIALLAPHATPPQASTRPGDRFQEAA